MSHTILILSPVPLYPLDMGSKRDIWGHVTFFIDAGWRVVLVECRGGRAPEPERRHTPSPVDIAYHFVDRKVDDWSLAEHPSAVAALQGIVDSHQPDVVFCEYAHYSTLAAALDLKGARLWFRPHNFELPHCLERAVTVRPWQEWRGLGAPKSALSWVKRLFRDALRRARKERLMHRIADRLFFISYSDQRFMARLYRGRATKNWVPPFVEYNAISVKHDKAPLDIVYAGVHGPGNEQTTVGAFTLLDTIAPAVESAMPGVFRFNIVGAGGRVMYNHYSSSSVVIHDYIEDLAAFMQGMDIACLPIRIGWGCKIKMIEALAAGLPVVGAAQTFRGIESVEEAYSVCRSTSDYVEALRGLQQAGARKRMGELASTAYGRWLEEGRHALLTAIQEVET